MILNNNNNIVSRRKFLKTAALAASAFTFLPHGFERKSTGSGLVQNSTNKKPDSLIGGIQVGAITFAFRDQPERFLLKTNLL